MVSALDSGLKGPGSCPGRVIALCSWSRNFALTVSLSTRETKTGVPSRRSSNTPSCFMLRKPG